MLPFTPDQFLDIFRAYNAATVSVQVLAYVLGAVCIYFVVHPSRSGHLLVSACLALMWVWTGSVYHGLFFARINPIAIVFGVGFVVQGLWIMWEGYRGWLIFGAGRDVASTVGWALIGYAVVLYPFIGFLAGHMYPETPMFGITPCPLTLFTFGMFLLTKEALPLRLLVLPVIWSLIGGSAAILLGIVQDLPLLLSGVVAGLAVLVRHLSTVTPGPLTSDFGDHGPAGLSRLKRWKAGRSGGIDRNP